MLKILLFENTSKNKKTFLFVWYFTHLIVSLQTKLKQNTYVYLGFI